MWFKNEQDLDRAIEQYEDKHGILCWTEGNDTIRDLFSGLLSEADGEGTVAKGFIYVTRHVDGTPVYVLARVEDLHVEGNAALRGYLELISAPVGKPKLRKRTGKKAPAKSKKQRKLRPVVKVQPEAATPDPDPTASSAEAKPAAGYDDLLAD